MTYWNLACYVKLRMFQSIELQMNIFKNADSRCVFDAFILAVSICDIAAHVELESTDYEPAIGVVMD